ncbi:MAG: hypothetical protein WA755_08545 [Candidatus Acidiferrales bacterium]
MAATPVPPPQKKSNAIWWILGIIGAGIVVLVMAALVLVTFIVHRIHVKQSGENVEILTPAGDVRVNNGESHPTGLPVYPGATASKDSGADIEVSANQNRAGIAVEKYHTADSRETVQAWYAKRLGSSYRVETQETNRANTISGLPTKLETGDVAFVDDHNNGARVIALKKVGDSTDIVLVRVGQREPQ